MKKIRENGGINNTAIKQNTNKIKSLRKDAKELEVKIEDAKNGKGIRTMEINDGGLTPENIDKYINDKIAKEIERNNNNTMDIEENENIAENEKNIEDNKKEIVKNTEDIKNTNERVDRMDSRISGIEKKLGETRSEIKRIGAQSAAMTSAAVSAVANLEPGEIGVGAGYGSYGGKDAISISVGTRVNENVNVNGSWSRTSGSESNDMYGVGVGYKFSFKS